MISFSSHRRNVVPQLGMVPRHQWSCGDGGPVLWLERERALGLGGEQALDVAWGGQRLVAVRIQWAVAMARGEELARFPSWVWGIWGEDLHQVFLWEPGEPCLVLQQLRWRGWKPKGWPWPNTLNVLYSFSSVKRGSTNYARKKVDDLDEGPF